MRTKLNQFFSLDGLFYAAPVIYFLISITYAVFSSAFLISGFSMIAIQVLKGILILLIPIAFDKHEKSLMKGLVGAAVMGEMMSAITWLGNTHADNLSFALDVVYFVAALVIFVNHFLLSLDHNAKDNTILVSQITAVVLFLAGSIWDVLYAMQSNILGTLIDILSMFAFAYIVISVETRVNDFKTARQNGKKKQ